MLHLTYNGIALTVYFNYHPEETTTFDHEGWPEEVEIDRITLRDSKVNILPCVGEEELKEIAELVLKSVKTEYDPY